MRTRKRGWLYLVATLVLLLTLIAGTGVLNAEPMGTAMIASPGQGERLTGNVTISGTAVVNNFQFYKLEFALANAGFALIGDLMRTPVTDGTLGTWDSTRVPDGAYTLRLTVVDNAGNYLMSQVPVMVGNTTPAPPPEAPRRGCLACHVLVMPSGAFTLPFEAHAISEETGLQHPNVSPSGVSIRPTDQTGIEPCLECHRPGSGARSANGVAANLSLRDIVHPAHMFSEIFVGEFMGNCFSCHNPGPDGEWNVLSEAVDVNERGVPKVVPIPGQLPPS
ncbi:MAG: hypothetical protein ACYC4L_14350 [Chloroflexota bacterium]